MNHSIRKTTPLRFALTSLAATAAFLTPAIAAACACGCGVFNPGLPGLPNTVYSTKISLQYDAMNQNETQHGSSVVSGDLNPDKQIKTNFFNLDIQHMFNRQWGVMAMIPDWDRHFVTDNNGTVGQTDQSQGVSQ
ncbi:MAG: hypothetical protein ACYCSR_11165 [Thiomonas sp.]|uniref:Lipoprotein n=1 Tax=mine drainage metagenome TaxID=410659 RepID=E6PQT0_9ZZZZ